MERYAGHALVSKTTARHFDGASSGRPKAPVVFQAMRSRRAKGGGSVRRGEGTNLKKPAKTREELESAIRMEMEDICEWPTELTISVVPHEDTWKVVIMIEGPQHAERCDMIETIADRLRSQFDLRS
jgi:hypothetical protein